MLINHYIFFSDQIKIKTIGISMCYETSIFISKQIHLKLIISEWVLKLSIVSIYSTYTNMTSYTAISCKTAMHFVFVNKICDY